MVRFSQPRCHKRGGFKVREVRQGKRREGRNEKKEKGVFGLKIDSGPDSAVGEGFVYR